MKLTQLSMPGKESLDLGVSGKASDTEAFIVKSQIFANNYE